MPKTIEPTRPLDNGPQLGTSAICADAARRTRRLHGTVLLLSCVVVAAAFLFDVRADERICVRGLPAYPLPPSCMSRQYLGLECPGCGLTRSFVHLAHGDWRASLAVHRLGWLLALALLVQFPYRAIGMARPEKPLLGSRGVKVFSYTLIALLISNWLVNMVGWR
ncbi:MAG: DUF2752 domain-containing protein [Pirellulales bacterium]